MDDLVSVRRGDIDFKSLQSRAILVSQMLEGLECDITKEVIQKTVYDLVVNLEI